MQTFNSPVLLASSRRLFPLYHAGAPGVHSGPEAMHERPVL